MSDPVTAFFLLTLAFGAGAVMGLMSSRADTYRPAPGFSEPSRHVAPVRVGTCDMCGRDGQRLTVVAVHPLLDPEDLCDGCCVTEVEA